MTNLAASIAAAPSTFRETMPSRPLAPSHDRVCAWLDQLAEHAADHAAGYLAIVESTGDTSFLADVQACLAVYEAVASLWVPAA